MAFDPKKLEPEDGDFSRYIEKLNRGTIKELKSLQVSDAQHRASADNTLHSPINAAQARINMETPADAPAEQAKLPRAPRRGNRALPLLVFFVGFATFATGGMMGDERIVWAGMMVSVFGMAVAAITNKRR